MISFSRQEKIGLAMALILFLSAVLHFTYYRPLAVEYGDLMQRIVMYENISCGIIPPEVRPGEYLLIKRNCTEVCGEQGCNYPNREELLAEHSAKTYTAMGLSVFAPMSILAALFVAAVMTEIKRRRK